MLQFIGMRGSWSHTGSRRFSNSKTQRSSKILFPDFRTRFTNVIYMYSSHNRSICTPIKCRTKVIGQKECNGIEATRLKSKLFSIIALHRNVVNQWW